MPCQRCHSQQQEHAHQGEGDCDHCGVPGTVAVRRGTLSAFLGWAWAGLGAAVVLAVVLALSQLGNDLLDREG
jgi:uncharacterized paraquat-inducible protein A